MPSAQIMEEVIKYRWGALPDEQREGIKTYISNLIIKLSTDDASFRRERTFLNKMNMILVQILKQARLTPAPQCGITVRDRKAIARLAMIRPQSLHHAYVIVLIRYCGTMTSRAACMSAAGLAAQVAVLHS